MGPSGLTLSPRTLKVAVLGAGGTIAPAIVRDLAESEEVERLRLLDLNGERAAVVAKAQGQGKAESFSADARGDLRDRLDGIDVLVNSASYRVNMDAMRACLAARCHYLDLGGLYWMTSDQLELDSSFRDAGLLALLGMGSAPGKTNVMATRAIRELDGQPKSIHVSAARRDLDPPGGFSLPYALDTLLDQLKMKPIVVRDGRVCQIEPLTPGKSVAFPEPIGRADTIYTLQSELRTFPESFGCRSASFRLSLSPDLLGRLRDLAARPAEIVARAAANAEPASPHTFAAHLVEASRNGATARVTALTEPHAQWGLGGGVVSTAAPAAAAVRLLARGELTATGALPPERCVDPDVLFAELERRGCSFRVEFEAAPTKEPA
jgi:saccharopine dehydrogenase (NAD+, L-lysine-forming)